MNRSSSFAPSVAAAIFVLLVAAFGLTATDAGASGVGSPEVECQRAFGAGYVGFKIDGVNEADLNGTYTDSKTGFKVEISNVNSTLHTFDYQSSWPANVIVKGGPGQGTLYPSSDNGTGLHPPFNTSSNKGWYGISHITFCWQPQGDDKAELEINKTADDAVIAPGGSTAFTLTVVNHGPQTARGTIVSDIVPEGLNITAVDSPCTVDAQLVECEVGDLNAGETRSFRIHVTAENATVPVTTDDQLDISKVETQISLQAGETGLAQITCGDGSLMTDGAVRVDHVDQGTGDLGSVEIHRVNSVDESSYGAELTNHASGQAQAKLFGVCVGKTTTLGDHLTVGPLVSQTFQFNQGTNTAELTCGEGTTPVAPGYQVSGSSAVLLASAPTADNGRKFTIDVAEDGAMVTVSMRCLSNLTSGGAKLVFAPISRTIEVGPGQVASEQLTCAVGYKGIVAGWEYDGLVPLGNDPQPITRVFKVWNPTGQPIKATLHLLCLQIRTGGGGFTPKEYVNTGYVSSATPQLPDAVLSDTATVTTSDQVPATAGPAINRVRVSGRVLVVSVRTSGSGSVRVSSARAAKVGHRILRKGTVLGSGRISGSYAKVKLSRIAAKAIRSGKVKSVRVSATVGGQTVSKNLRVRHR